MAKDGKFANGNTNESQRIVGGYVWWAAVSGA